MKDITRRQVLKTILVTTAGVGVTKFVDFLPFSEVQAAESEQVQNSRFLFGIMADAHYADAKNPSGSRKYRESVDKMDECVGTMNDEEDIEFLIELGDFTDGHSPMPVKDLKKMEAEFSQFKGAQHHVLGNHCHDNFSKKGFLSHINNTGFDLAEGHYCFDRGGIHFEILDPNYRSDGKPYNKGNFKWTDANIPEGQIKTLEKNLKNSGLPAIAFIHQRLDGTGKHFVNNAAEVRKVLEAYGKTLAVFQGHDHGGGYSEIKGIYYYTLRAMVEGSGLENNAYASVNVTPEGIIVKGYRKAVSREMEYGTVSDLKGVLSQ